MHPIQANMRSAPQSNGRAATIVRIVSCRTLDAEQELIDSSANMASPERNSDPHIGAEVNALARAKADIMLTNPVGCASPDGGQIIDASIGAALTQCLRRHTSAVFAPPLPVPAKS